MINSRDKGARGEREAASRLQALTGMPAHRGQQYKGGQDSPDVIGGIEGCHFEIKWVERLNIYEAMAQAMRDADTNTSVVISKRNLREPLLTIRLADLVIFSCLVLATVEKYKVKPVTGGNNESNQVFSV
jgi:Holliday junction resolvase